MVKIILKFIQKAKEFEKQNILRKKTKVRIVNLFYNYIIRRYGIG
jgi:hypothetical protein